jgi:hypothetical protein
MQVIVMNQIQKDNVSNNQYCIGYQLLNNQAIREKKASQPVVHTVAMPSSI